MKIIVVGMITMALAGLTVNLSAHHGTSTFDGETLITIEGKVLEFNWTNPHGSVLLESAEGLVYRLEADGPSLLMPLGVSRDSLQVGDSVIAFVSPSNTGSEVEFLGREIITESGNIVRLSVRYARDLQTGRMPASDSVLGTWVPDRTGLFAFVASREGWSLTEKGQAALAAYDITQPFSQAQCIAVSSPTVMMYPTAKVFALNNNQIDLNVDWMGVKRIIYMDGGEYPANERYLQGYSIGQWEGETLVVDTRNFTDNPMGLVFGVPSGVQKRLVERFNLNPDGYNLTYSFTLEDAEYLLEPATGEFQWRYRPDVAASSVPCDLESAGRYLTE